MSMPDHLLEPMTPEQQALFDKASRMIDTSGPQHRDCLMRWLSLMNAQVNSRPVSWSIIGASMGLQRRVEDRFGRFRPMAQPVASIDRQGSAQ